MELWITFSLYQSTSPADPMVGPWDRLRLRRSQILCSEVSRNNKKITHHHHNMLGTSVGTESFPCRENSILYFSQEGLQAGGPGKFWQDLKNQNCLCSREALAKEQTSQTWITTIAVYMLPCLWLLSAQGRLFSLSMRPMKQRLALINRNMTLHSASGCSDTTAFRWDIVLSPPFPSAPKAESLL